MNNKSLTLIDLTVIYSTTPLSRPPKRKPPACCSADTQAVQHYFSWRHSPLRHRHSAQIKFQPCRNISMSSIVKGLGSSTTQVGGISPNTRLEKVMVLLGFVVAYVLCLAVYRLYFSPLSKFPGPRIAGIQPAILQPN